MNRPPATLAAPPAEPGATPEPAWHELLGVRVQAMNAQDLRAAVAASIRAGAHHLFGNHNLHSVYLYHRDPRMRRFYARARYVFIDGMPLVWAGQLLGLSFQREHRNTPIDWLPDLLGEAVEQGWRVFYLGSAPGVAERGAEILRRRFPGLQIETGHGFFDATPGSAEAEAVLARIRAYRPHLLCVGMGMPRQEHWIEAYAERTGANVILSLGALMDLIAGELPTPPRWLARAGFEWLYRLVSHPGRVWRRYLVEPWSLLPLLVRDLVRRRLLGRGSGSDAQASTGRRP